MVGMIESIFGKTPYQLQEERKKQRNKLLSPSTAPTQEARAAQDIGSLLGLGAAMLFKDTSVDPEMEKARQVEAQQTALNERLGNIDRPDDPRRFMILADAAKEVGDEEGYTKYINLAANYEQLAERRRQQYRDQEMKEADELSAQLDMRDKGIALSTIFDKDTSEEERNKALQNFYQVGGTANDLYAYQQIGESLLKGSQGITKLQSDIRDKFVSDISNGVVSPAEVYGNYKSIYGDDFIVPESFLGRVNTNNRVTGKGLNLTPDNSNKNNKTPSVPKQNEANFGTLYDVLGLPTEEEIKRAGTYAFSPWELD